MRKQGRQKILNLFFGQMITKLGEKERRREKGRGRKDKAGERERVSEREGG